MPAELENHNLGIKVLEVENFRTQKIFYPMTFEDNFDASKNIVFKFRIPLGTVKIIGISMNIYSKKYRGYSASNGNESSHVHEFAHFHDFSHEHTGTMTSHSHGGGLGSRDHDHSVSTAPGTTGSGTLAWSTTDFQDMDIATTNNPDPNATGNPIFTDGSGSLRTNTGPGGPHTHTVNYGLLQDTYPQGMGITIDGTDRTTVLGGLWNPNTVSGDRIILEKNITPYIINNSVNNGIHEIQLYSTQNGRILIELYINCVIKN